jgi:hypothetical protein
VREDKRKIIAFCVGGGKNGVEEMVRKLECPVHIQAPVEGGKLEVVGVTKTGEKPGRRIED